MLSLDPRRVLAALARSRLLQFFLIGAVGFALSPSARREREIVVEPSAVSEALRLEQARVARPLTPDEKQHVMAGLVADEVLFREGLRLGIGVDDAVVRARVADRMRGHLEAATPASVTADELREEASVQSARMPVRVRLSIAFVSKERPNAAGDADALARALAASPETAAPFGGDRAPLPLASWWSHDDLARGAGPSVARAAEETPAGTWSAPIATAWGFYLVRPLERRSPSPAEASEVATAEVLRRKRAEAVARAISRVGSGYDVTVRSPAGEPAYDPRAVAAARSVARKEGVD